MALFLSPLLRQRFLDSNGLPLVGGNLYSYEAGTTTPQDTYTNSTGTLNTNPVVLDSQGYCDVWIDPTLSYKFLLQDSSGNTQWSIDNVSSPFEVTAWSATISYSMGEIVADSSGYGLFYVSLTNNNVANPLTSVSNWRRLGGNIRTISTNATLLATDELVRSNSTSGNLLHTLPPCSSTSIGTKITVKDVGTGGNVTQIKGSGSDNIDGSNTWGASLYGYAEATFQNNGTSWDVFGITVGAIGTQQIGSQAVTAAKIANSTITAAQIANTTITAAQIANATITTTQISASADIAGTQLASNTISAAELYALQSGSASANSSTSSGTPQLIASVTASTGQSGFMVALVPASSTGASIFAQAGASGTITLAHKLSGFPGTETNIASWTITNPYTSNTLNIPANLLFFDFTGSAGFIYRLYISASAGTIGISNASLLVREIF